MKTEVIIACRGEIPANLERTVSAAMTEAAVCIVYDGRETRDRMKPRAGLRIEDPFTSPRGCGQARHHGITTSAAANVVLVDGHMAFPPGWIGKIERHLAKHLRDVTCCSTQSLTPKWEPMPGELYHGAYLAMNTIEPQVDIAGPLTEFFALCAKWRTDAPEKARVIQAPMGACYGMRREWYTMIGAPFKILEAWGGEEELLAVCGYLCGGRTYLLPLTCGHIHAAPHRERTIHPAGRWANRLAILWAMPDMDAAAALERHMRQTGVPWAVIDGLVTDERGERIEALRIHLSVQSRTWADMVKSLVLPRTDFRPEPKPLPARAPATIPTTHRTIPRPPIGDSSQVVTRPVEVCERCNAVNPFRKVGGPRMHSRFNVAYARCWKCGHKAQVRQYVA